MQAIICGAGIAGLTLAWWLEREGWEVLIVERAPGLHKTGYMIDFIGSGYDVAEKMDLIPKLRTIAYPIPEITYVNHLGKKNAGMSYRTFEKLLNGRLLSFMRNDLEKVLFESLSPAIKIKFDRTIVAVLQEKDFVKVTLNDGTQKSADLLIGADGIHSQIRRLVFGVEKNFLHYLGFHTAAFIFQDTEITNELGENFKILSSPGKEVGFYPLRNKQIASFFVHRVPHEILPSSSCEELNNIYGNLGWILPKALQKCYDQKIKIYYDLVAQIEMSHWHQERVVLVGDACQAVSLLAGQGASMAMAGAYVLASELKKNMTIEVALEKYQSIIKPIILKQQAAGRKTANWFAPASQFNISLRNAIMKIAALPGFSWILRSALLGGANYSLQNDS